MSNNNGNFGGNKGRNPRNELTSNGALTHRIVIPGFEISEEKKEFREQKDFSREPREPRMQRNNDRNDRPERTENRPERTENRNFENRMASPKMPTAPQRAPIQSARNFFVFDIETIPCIETARTFFNLSTEVSEEEVVKKLNAYHMETTNGQNEFHRQLFHKIICVSFIAGTIQPLKGGREKYTIKSIKTGGRNGESEEEILRAIFSYLNKHPSRLISFNGRGFDLPVLQYRAMKYGIDARWIYNDGYYNYNHRYSIEKHCDLLDMFSNFGASARVKMAEVAALFKVPCKFNGLTGASIYENFKANKVEEICNYCEDDVIATYILYLRFMEHSGKLSAEGYNIVIDNLLALLRADKAPVHQTLFAEKFLSMNGGDVHLKLPSIPVFEKPDGENGDETRDTSEGIETSTEEEIVEEITMEVENLSMEEQKVVDIS